MRFSKRSSVHHTGSGSGLSVCVRPFSVPRYIAILIEIRYISEPAFVISAHEQYGLPLDFTPDGKTLFTGGFDGTVHGWSVGDWSETVNLEAHEQSVNCGAVLGMDTLVTGSTDTTVRVWSLTRVEKVGVLKGHKKTAAGLTAHPTRKVVASASYDTTV